MPQSAARTLTSPRMLLLHATGIAAVTIAVLLALWQYDAWQAGRTLAARDLADARPVPLEDVLGPDDAYPGDQVGRPVRLAGEWLPDSTVEVGDRALDGRDGRWVVTPVAVCAADCAGAPAILVVRGWIAAGAVVPPAPTGRVEVTGWLQPGEGQGLPDPDPTDAVLPELRIASAVQHVDTDLYGGYVIARVSTGSTTRDGSTTGDGLSPVTPDALPQPDAFTSLRNLLYAAEWVVFGGFALFLWWRWSRDELDRVAALESADVGEPDDGSPDGDSGETVPTAEIASSS
ncbi:MAG TPA: SURF1 family protein [Nocardioides sp.]|uniref:SURF1 family protein n=1 Tax=Nocardioides sp. TaxID=35761 RepID=UPI002D810253|nr:SURF1 family protein [Nocardioides sp.]HET6652613.1 SURF1 family protein [Nocardioides sp.]